MQEACSLRRIRKILQLLKLEANNLQRSNKTNGKVASCEPNMWGSQYQIMGKFCVKRAVIYCLCWHFFNLAFGLCYRAFHHPEHFTVDFSLPDLLHNGHPFKCVWALVTHMLVYSMRHINSFEEVEQPIVNLNNSQLSIIQTNVGRPDKIYHLPDLIAVCIHNRHFCTTLAHPYQLAQAAAFFTAHTTASSPPLIYLSPISSWVSKLLFCLNITTLGSLFAKVSLCHHRPTARSKTLHPL